MKHDKAMMKTAVLWSKESYCKRRQVGCVIADGRDPLAVGFNGTISGLDNQCEVTEPFESLEEMQDYNKHFVVDCPDCDASGQDRAHPYGRSIGDCKKCNGIGHLKDTNVTSEYVLHAEYNAIIRAAQKGDLKGTTLYVTLAPCKDCSKLIAAHNIAEVFYRETYKCMEGVEFLKSCGIKVTHLPT